MELRRIVVTVMVVVSGLAGSAIALPAIASASTLNLQAASTLTVPSQIVPPLPPPIDPPHRIPGVGIECQAPGNPGRFCEPIGTGNTKCRWCSWFPGEAVDFYP